jgi:hypothetical protein
MEQGKNKIVFLKSEEKYSGLLLLGLCLNNSLDMLAYHLNGKNDPVIFLSLLNIKICLILRFFSFLCKR